MTTVERRRARSIAVAAALILAVSGVVLLSDNSPASAAPLTARFSPTAPLPGELTVLRGTAAPAKRLVTLQVFRGGSWKALRSARTGARTAYAFSVRASTTNTSYRVVAPATKVKKKKYPARASNVMHVVARAGSGRLSVAPAPTGQLSNGTANVTPVVASFTPARPGKGVSVQRLVNGSWSQVAAGTQNASGVLRTNVPKIDPGNTTQYRTVTAPGAGAGNIASPPVTPSAKQLVWSDEFNDTTTLDATKWGTREQPRFGRRQCAQPSSSMVSVANSYATLSASMRPGTKGSVGPDGTTKCTFGVWDNAMIGTSEGTSPFLPQYGTVAARIRFQAGRGMHGGFWLQDASGTGTGIEIDAAEYFGDTSTDKLTTLLQHPDGNGGVDTAGTRNIRTLPAGKTPSNGWHVYSVDWTSSGYTFRVDGVATLTWTKPPFVSQVPEEIVLSLLTSDWELSGDTRPSSKMFVDWVRTWQSPS